MPVVRAASYRFAKEINISTYYIYTTLGILFYPGCTGMIASLDKRKSTPAKKSSREIGVKNIGFFGRKY